MNDNGYSDNLQYNSCISRGICSINPRTSALQNVLGLYLNLCAKYSIKLYKKKAPDKLYRDFILDTIAILVSNPEFTENCFIVTIKKLKTFLPELIDQYNTVFGQKDFKGEDILSSEIFKKCEDIVEAIKLGEQIFQKNIKKISADIRNIFKVLLIIAKGISINLLDIASYCEDTENDEAFLMVLNILSMINDSKYDADELKTLALKGSECNTKLMHRLHIEQEKRYGTQKIAEVSYTTTPSKAVLTVGSNIRELEIILEALKNTSIDIYTHDDMMVAHTFPEFGKYENLKGQYGYGLENCLIDFATFPGPIILTRHSMHNVENLYRGLLYSTDNNLYKGVIKIENNDFREVIEAANQAKGFKRGKVCETVQIGYDFEVCKNLIKQKLDSEKYRKIVVIGLKDYSAEQKSYFEKLIKLISDEILIISFSYNEERDNLLCFNTCFDSFAVVRTAVHLLQYDVPIDVFLPKCGINTIPEMIYFAAKDNTNVYTGECEPIMINPSLKNTLKEVFGIKIISTAKKDSMIINKLPNNSF